MSADVVAVAGMAGRAGQKVAPIIDAEPAAPSVAPRPAALAAPDILGAPEAPGGPLEDMAAEEVVALGRTPYAGWLGLRGERAADRAAVAEALRAVDAADYAGRPLSQLSGGERQRAFLAMALAQQPRLLL